MQKKAQAKAQTVSRILTITILSVLSYFVYSDLKAENLQDVQSIYDDTSYLDELHEIDLVLQELQTTYPETKEPLFIAVCWSATQQRLVPAYMGCW